MYLLFSLPCVCAPRFIYRNDPSRELTDTAHDAVIIPIRTMNITCLNGKRKTPDTLVFDTFLIDAANAFLLNEVNMYYSVRTIPETDRNTAIDTRQNFYSVLTADTDAFEATAACVRECAARYTTDLVIVPYRTTCRYITVESKQRYRKNHSDHYHRPLRCRAEITLHIQIWNSDGALLYERVECTDSGRPMIVMKPKKDSSSVNVSARPLYNPPIIRALSLAISRVINIGE
jgi:hypothetical protein